MRHRRVSPLKAALFWGAVAWLLVAVMYATVAHAWEVTRSPANNKLCYAQAMSVAGIPEARLNISYHQRWARWGLGIDFLNAGRGGFENSDAINGEEADISIRFPDGELFMGTFSIQLNGRLLMLIPVNDALMHQLAYQSDVELWLHHTSGATMLARFDLIGADEAIFDTLICAQVGEEL